MVNKCEKIERNKRSREGQREQAGTSGGHRGGGAGGRGGGGREGRSLHMCNDDSADICRRLADSDHIAKCMTGLTDLDWDFTLRCTVVGHALLPLKEGWG